MIDFSHSGDDGDDGDGDFDHVGGNDDYDNNNDNVGTM